MARRKSKRLIRSLNAEKVKAPDFLDDEADVDKPPLKKKQTTFSMALPMVTPDSKLQHRKNSKIPPTQRPTEKATGETVPRILAAHEFGHYPKWGETPEELMASINFETPDGQDAYGNMLNPNENNDKKMPAKGDTSVDTDTSAEKTSASIDRFVNKVNQGASKPASVRPTHRLMSDVDCNDVSSEDSMAEYAPALARPRHSIIKNTGFVYYEHLHGGLALFRVEDSESGRDGYIEQAVHGLNRTEFREFKTFPVWLSARPNTDDKLTGNRDPFYARGIVLFKGSTKKEAEETVSSFFDTLTTFLNNWTYAGKKLDCVTDEGGHWYHYVASQSTLDRTPKNKRKLCDLVCIHDSFSIVKSIATETLGYSSEHYPGNKKFTTMYFNPPYTPVMMSALRMETSEG